MIVLGVLLGVWAIFRLAGRMGVERLDSWRGALPYALAVMFLFTAAAHFNDMRYDMIKMVPPWVPAPAAVVAITGVLEILGAIGLMIPRTRRAAGVALILFLLAVFPANVYAARNQVQFGGRPATALWLRAPMQLLFIGLLGWGAVWRDPGAASGSG
jgi:uncharacterized membrane protein